ncbi:hypothetical protein MKK84_32780 [Methylobacterium sp. E-065]|uniref:hypothetical protein n=1 Tax=Methylobacterium sp. E-065 TaxID=2836583 RepID=UPI001FB96F67|nr:hypothetical protein [Methylobacterium sp. E-065]MCJ2022124.1 hypothetical protein [Methylobacterium sp. E-065]
MKPNACHMPEPAPRSEAEIYRSIRDVVIRSHCKRKVGAHQCAGAITITRTDITLNCRLCGDLRQTLAS